MFLFKFLFCKQALHLYTLFILRRLNKTKLNKSDFSLLLRSSFKNKKRNVNCKEKLQKDYHKIID